MRWALSAISANSRVARKCSVPPERRLCSTVMSIAIAASSGSSWPSLATISAIFVRSASLMSRSAWATRERTTAKAAR